MYEARSPLGLFSLSLPTAQRNCVCPREEKVEGCQRVFRGAREGWAAAHIQMTHKDVFLPPSNGDVPVIKNLITRCACAEKKLICLIGSSLALSCSFSF